MTKQILPKKSHRPENAVYHYERLQLDLFAVIDELYHFAERYYNDTIEDNISAILDRMEVSEQLKGQVLPQLIWWVIFKAPDKQNGSTILEAFLQVNQSRLKQKGTDFYNILTSWLAISPGFYMTRTVTDNQQSGTLMNIVGLKQYTIIVCNQIFAPLQRGELVTGFLLPIGRGMYTSPVDLFHISADDTPKVTWEVLLHFHHHTVSSAQSPPPELYPALIQSALEVINFTFHLAGNP